MKKKMKKLALAGLSTMALSLLSIQTRAENYTAVNGTGTEFDKYLIIDKDANVPAASFSFTIAAGTPLAASETGMEVLAGPVSGGYPRIENSAVFTPADTAYTAAQAGDDIELGTNEKYAFQTIAVDFSGVAFDEPGIYRYVISETPLDDAGAFTQDASSKILDVYVVDEGGSLRVASYVLHNSADAPARNNNGGSADVAEALSGVEDKTTGFVNRYSTKDLTITKLVNGNQASRDKYFRYTLSIANAGAGSKIAVDVTANAETAPLASSATVYSETVMGEANNVTLLTCDENGALTHDFYLKHGQSITLKQLPAGAEWSLSEANEDYVSADLNSVDSASYAAHEGTIAAADVTIGYQNTRDGIIPTGIVLSAGPYAMMVVLAAFGMVMLGKSRAAH